MFKKILFPPDGADSGGGSGFSAIAGVTDEDKADVLSKGTLVESPPEDNLNDDPSNEISLENASDIFENDAFANKKSDRRASGPLQKTNNAGEKQLKTGRMQQYESEEAKQAALEEKQQKAQQEAAKKKALETGAETDTTESDISEEENDEKTDNLVDSGDEDVSEESKESKAERNYNGLDEKTASYLKKLPNGIYNHVRPLVDARISAEKELSETKTALETLKKDPNRIPDSWYDHNDAYTLSPEYLKLTENYSKATQEASHWKQQLINIETALANPEEIDKIPWYDTKGTAYKASIAAKQEATEQYMRALQSQQSLQNQSSVIQRDWNQKLGEAKNHYKQYDQFFDNLIPELRPSKDDFKTFMDALHPFDRNSRTADLGAKMFSTILQQGKYINKLLKTNKSLRAASANGGTINNNSSNDAKAAGPKSKGVQKVAAGGKGGNKNLIDAETFMEEMRS